jgi:hypothetical protein
MPTPPEIAFTPPASESSNAQLVHISHATKRRAIMAILMTSIASPAVVDHI